MAGVSLKHGWDYPKTRVIQAAPIFIGLFPEIIIMLLFEQKLYGI